MYEMRYINKAALPYPGVGRAFTYRLSAFDGGGQKPHLISRGELLEIVH